MQKGIGILVVLWLISISCVNLVTIADHPFDLDAMNTRSGIISDMYGGEVIETFDNNDGIEFIQNGYISSGKIRSYDVDPFDDFEDYSDNDDIIDHSGWFFHSVLNSGSFTAQKDHSMTPSGGTIGVQYCGSTSIASYILSDEFSMTKGYVSIKIATNYVAPGTQQTTLINLYGSPSTHPESSDLIARIGFLNGGLYALNALSGGWNELISSTASNRWYTLTIEFDCSKQVYNVHAAAPEYGQDSGVKTFDFVNSKTEFNRIGLIAGSRVGTTYISSFWDDVCVFDHYEESYIMTKTLEIPSGMVWNHLVIVTPSGSASGVGITFCKEDRTPINGIPSYTDQKIILLDVLNSVKVRSIKLNITLTRSIGINPMIDGYVIEYNSTNAWRDSLQTDRYTSDLNGVGISSGTAYLLGGQNIGYLKTHNITIPAGHYWEKLYFNLDGSDIRMFEIQVINPDNDKVVKSFLMNEGPTIDVSSLDPFENPVIRLRFFFYRIDGNHPVLKSTSISWRPNILPSITEVSIPERVHRTESIPISAVIIDKDQPINELDIEFLYIAPDKYTIDKNYFKNYVVVESENKCHIDFCPPSDSSLGNYSIIIGVKDDFGKRVGRTFSDAIFVENNAPTDPRISLSPIPAYTDSTIRSDLTVPSTDRDLETIYYTYRVFINEEERSEFNKVRVPALEYVSIPPSATRKHDVIRVEVNATDGLNHTAVYAAEIIIKNSLPTLTTKENIYAIIDEDHVDDEQIDFSELIRDKDDDELTFTFDISDDIDLEVDPSTLRLIIMPHENYTGTKTVPVTVTDGQSELRFNITIYVNPVNDPPIGSILSPPSVAKFLRGDEIWLKAEASDSDNRPLEIAYSWKLDGKEIGTTKEMKYRIDEPGEYLITCTVNDGEFLVQIGEISLTIEKPEPPYSIEEIHTLYEKNTPPVRMEIRNADGLPSQADNTDIPEINITKLECTADDEFAFITMTLGSNPVPEGYGWDQSGAKGMYRVFFVKNSFREQDYDQSKLSLDNIDMIRPSRGLTYLPAEESYLSWGERNSYGSPTVNGSQIEWTIPMTDLEQAGVTMPLRMYATSTYMSTEDGMIIAGFDTIGYEAQTHPTDLMIKEVSTDKGKVGIGLLVIFIIIFLLIGLAIGAAIMFFVRGKMEKPSEEEMSEGEGLEEKIPPQPNNAPVNTGQLPNRIPVMPPLATQAPTQPSPPATTVAQDPKQ